MPSISAQDLVALVRPIVEEEMPDEVLAFDLSATDFAKTVASDQHPATMRENPAHFGFSGAKEAVEILECLQLLAAVYGVFEKLKGWPLHKRDSLSEVRECLISHCKEHNISDAIARRIAERQLTRLLSSMNKALAKGQ